MGNSERCDPYILFGAIRDRHTCAFALLLLSLAGAALAVGGGDGNPGMKTDQAALERWRALRVGAFIHWTPYVLATESHPNVIILLADDLGKYDVSLYGGKDVPTPNIDALARSGVTFTNAYCTSPICSPSRAGLLTGRYQQRFGHEFQPGDAYPYCRLQILLGNATIFRNQWKLDDAKVYPTSASAASQDMRQSEITLADMAKTQGYATAAIGK